MTQTTKGSLDLGDGTLYYEIAGDGEPLILSHAAFLDRRMFDAQWDVLAQRFRVIRYDMRGFGQSGVVERPLCRRDDLHRLLEHLAVTQAHFIGCSNGGGIVLDLALEQPGLASSLILVESTPSGFDLRGEPPHYMLEMFDAAQRGDFEHASELQIRIWLDGQFREPDQIDKALRAKALLMNRLPVERRTFLIGDMQPVRPLDPPAVTRLNGVSCPLLSIVGALDHPELLRAADMMVEHIPNAHKVIIKDCGHVPSFERPDLFNQIVLDFLSDK